MNRGMACQNYDPARNHFFLDLHGVLKRDAARVIGKRLEECCQYGIDSLEVVYGTPDFFDGSIASALHRVVSSDPRVLSARLPADFLEAPEQFTQRVGKIVVWLLRAAVTQPRDERMCFGAFTASRERDIWLRRTCENPYFPLRDSLTAPEAARFIGEGCTARDIPHETVSMEQLEALCRSWRRQPAREKTPAAQPSAEEQSFEASEPSEPSVRDRWEQLWSETAQSLAAGDYARAQVQLQACMEISAEEPDSAFLARTLGALGDLDLFRNRTSAAESYYHSSLAAFDSLSLPSSNERLEVEGRLVHTLLAEDRVAEAAAVWRQARERLAAQPSPSAVQSIYVFSHEAVLRALLDDLDGAANLLGEAVRLAENNPAVPLIACGSLRLRLGLLQAARGDLREALRQLCLAEEELEVAGAPLVYVVLCYREMAVTASELGYRERPKKTLRNLLANITGSDYAEQRARAQLWKALGEVMFRDECWDEAAECYLEGLETALRLPADMRREIFEIHQDLGNNYTHAGQHQQAEDRFQTALRLAAELFPPEHPCVAHCKQNLAVLYIRTARLDRARSLNEEALLALETFYNRPHPDIASAHHNYGLTLVGMGEWDEAERELRAALGMYESIFGELSPQLSRCLTSLGEMLVDRQRFTQARPILQRAIDLLDEELWNPLLEAEAYRALAQAQTAMGNSKAAAKSLQRADFKCRVAELRRKRGV